MQTYNEPGRGRKQCPKCGLIVHVRNKVCSCGHDFAVRSKSVVVAKPATPIALCAAVIPAATDDGGVSAKPKGNVLVPAGRCPYEFDSKNIRDWAKSVIVSYNKKHTGRVLTAVALQYWMRMNCQNRNSPETIRACEEIDKNHSAILAELRANNEIFQSSW